jgi:hypothetical protein
MDYWKENSLEPEQEGEREDHVASFRQESYRTLKQEHSIDKTNGK